MYFFVYFPDLIFNILYILNNYLYLFLLFFVLVFLYIEYSTKRIKNSTQIFLAKNIKNILFLILYF